MGLTPEQRIEHLLTEDVSPRARAVLTKAKNEITTLRVQAAALEQDAARYQYLQSIPPEQAQAFFWNYTSRKERSKAIDTARKEAHG